MATNYIKYRYIINGAVAKMPLFRYILNMKKIQEKYDIAVSKQRNKIKESSATFSSYVKEHIENHIEQEMNLLAFLRFKAPGLVLDYDSLNKDFFDRNKAVAARTVIAMNEVKLNCEYQRPRNTEEKNNNLEYNFYTKQYNKSFLQKRLIKYSQDQFYQFYNSFCQISLSPLQYEMGFISSKIYDFAGFLYKNFGADNGLEVIKRIENDRLNLPSFLAEEGLQTNEILEIMKQVKAIFSLHDPLASLNLLCSFYSLYGKEYLIENHFLYYEFTSLFMNIEESRFNNCAILVDPSPLFLKKWIRDDALTSLNLLCVFTNDSIKEFYESFMSGRMNVNFQSLSLMDFVESNIDFKKYSSMDCKAFVFGNHSIDRGVKEIILKKIVEKLNINDCFYYGYDAEIENNIALKSILDEGNLACNELHLFSSGILDVRDKKRTVLLCCSKNVSQNGMDIIQYTTKKVGDYQSLSPKKYSETVDSNILFSSSQRVRGLFDKQFRDAYKRADDTRNKATLYKFTDEIYFYYTHSWDEKNQSFRVQAYAVEPHFLKDGGKDYESKIKISNTLKRCRQKTEEDIYDWLNKEYPYSVFTSKGETIDIQKELVGIYKKAYKNKPITLKTFVYLHADLTDRLGEKQMDILKTLSDSSLGFCLIDNLNSEIVNDNIHNLFELRRWHQAKAILSYAINVAIEENHSTRNLIKDEVLEESNRKDRAFTQGREHLTIKFLTAKENVGIYKKITKDLDNPLNLGAYIKLLTGLESNIVCALQWMDFVMIEDYNPNAEKYQLLIRRQLCNDGHEYTGFERREMYRKVPCCEELAVVLLTKKKRLMRKVNTNDSDRIGEIAIVEGDETLATNRNTGCIAPRELTKYCNAFVKSYRKDYDLTTSIPDSKRGTVETDFMNYGGDIYKTNYEHYCVHVANFDRGELDYLLGRQPETPFARNYCDYGNDASQTILMMKQNRYTQIFHKAEVTPALYTEGICEPLRYISNTHKDSVSEMNIKLSVENNTTITIKNQYGFDLTADLLMRRRKK